MCEADSLIREPTVSRGEFKPDHSLSDSDTLLRVLALAGTFSVVARRIELVEPLLESLILAQDERWRRA
jgi:hypothetical protein